MPNQNKDDSGKNENVVEVKGKKFTVTPEFKQLLDEEKAELTTKVKTVETQNQTLSQRIAELGKAPPKNKDDDVSGDDDHSIGFDDLMDRPADAIGKEVAKQLKKMGIDPSKVGDTSAIEKKLELKQHQQKYWEDFYREHSYFDENEHDIFLRPLAQKLLPSIKDLPLKDGRKKIAEAMANAMGRALKDGKLVNATDGKHKTQNGMQLESADGGTVDNDADGDNTTVTERTGSMAEIVRSSKRSPYSNQKKGGKLK